MLCSNESELQNITHFKQHQAILPCNKQMFDFLHDLKKQKTSEKISVNCTILRLVVVGVED